MIKCNSEPLALYLPRLFSGSSSSQSQKGGTWKGTGPSALHLIVVYGRVPTVDVNRTGYIGLRFFL